VVSGLNACCLVEEGEELAGTGGGIAILQVCLVGGEGSGSVEFVEADACAFLRVQHVDAAVFIAETINAQYKRRELIHKDSRILPEFNLKTIKAVQSITGMKPEKFDNWFDALHYMEDEIDKIDYDICLFVCLIARKSF